MSPVEIFSKSLRVTKGVTSPSRASTPGDAPQSPTEIPPSSPSETPLTLPVIQPRKSAVSTTLGPLQEDEEEEMVTVKRVPTVTLQIWGDLLKTRGFDVVKGKLVRSPSKANPRTQALHTQIQELASPLRGKSQDPLGNNDVDAAEGPRSALASFRRTKSLAAFASNLKDSSTSKQLLQRDSTVFIANAAPSSLSLSGVPPPLDEPLEGLVEESDELPALPAAGPSIDRSQTKEQRNVGRKGKGANKSGLFSGLTFHVLGEAKSPSVRSAVEEGGGTLLPTSGEGGTENDEDVDYILVRLVRYDFLHGVTPFIGVCASSFTLLWSSSGSKIFREDLDHTQRRKYRTECWLERCLFEERICNPEEHISFVPLGTEIPIPGQYSRIVLFVMTVEYFWFLGAENLSLSFSGLTQSESCWIKRLIRALGELIITQEVTLVDSIVHPGIPLAPNFSRRTTHLLCPTREGTKYEKALEWAIPVVDMEWLGAIAQSGVVPFVSKSAPGGDVPQEKPISSMKGKERAVDIGGMDVMLGMSHFCGKRAPVDVR